MKLQQFKVWVRRKLGEDDACGVKVELTDNQIDQALDDAKEWFNAFVGLHKESQFNLASGQSEYDMSAVTPRIDNIVKVWFPLRGTVIDFSVLYPGFLDVEGIPYDASIWSGGGYPHTSVVQTLQTWESSAKFLSSDLDWEYYADNTTDPETRLLRVMPAPADSGIAYYRYRVDPRDVKLEQYSQRHLWMIREWALAEAKYTLGRIRGKYSGGLPAAGGDRTLDGEQLIQEAREDKEKLEEKILDFQGPVLPMVY